jgi:hypothetical protein
MSSFGIKIEDPRVYQRNAPRMPVCIPAEVKVYLADGTFFDQGAALIRNLSSTGAFLAGLNLTRDCLPLQPFRFEIVLESGPWKGLLIDAVPVRFAGELSFGVRFNMLLENVA